jgi:hypothetical protein
MSRFTDPVRRYNLFDPIKIRISAQNEKGFTDTPSLVSVSAATAKVIPITMPSNSVSRGPLTSETIIQILITPLTTPSDTGDSEILSYHVEYDQGVNNWVTLVGDPTYNTQLYVLATDGITKGTIYSFRVRALNVYGWSP